MSQPHNSPDRPQRLVTLGRLALEGSDFERSKPLLLLSYLCLEGAKERRHLAELFWPDAANALASLSVELSRLKKHVGEVFSADNTRVYPRLRSDARALLDAVDGKEFLRATELYKGGFLPGVSAQEVSVELEEWIESTRAFLAARVGEALLGLGEQAAREGGFGDAARRAEEATREPLVTALDAEQVRRAYALLTAGEHPRAAELRGRAHALGLAADVTPDMTLEEARRRVGPRVTLNLPSYSSSFVGRGSEIRAVTELLHGEARLVTIVGMAGMGKSRLAVEVVKALQAEGRFSDGLHPVWLVALTSADEVPNAVAHALGVELQGRMDPLEGLTQHLADKRSLLYFDNFEHVVQCAPFLSALLERCPNLNILVTSRERLNLEEEWVVWLEGLASSSSDTEGADAPSEAAHLFVARAKRVDVTFSPTEEAKGAIEEVCRRVEGSPLALELAASWTRVMSCAEIAAQLGKGHVLSTTLRNVPERHRSIEAAFEYSWRLLSDEEQRVLRELSVFRGGFGWEAAQEVVGAGLSSLVSLVDKSLLVMRAGGRFGRHPLLYAFTQRRQAEHGLDALKKRHAAYYRAFLEACALGLEGSGGQEVLKNIEQESSNIQLAWAHWLVHAQSDAVAAALPALWRYFDFSSRSQEGAGLFASAHDRFAALGAHEALRATLLLRQAQLLYRVSRFKRALHVAQESFALARGEQRAAALSVLGTIYRVLQRMAEARGAYQRALRLLRADDDALRAKLLTNLASLEAAPSVGNLERAAGLYEESLALKRALGDDAATARTLYNYASLEQKRGDLAAAARIARECLDMCVGVGYKPLVPYAQNLLGKLLSHESREGRGYLLQALQNAESAEDSHLQCTVLVNLAYLGATTHAKHAVKLLGAAHTLRQQLKLSPLEEDEDYKQTEKSARAVLPSPEFDALWCEGKSLTLAGAVRLARDVGEVYSDLHPY